MVFGFIDNFIMISAGSMIDEFFGHLLGISPMAAAGLGNTLSDFVGIVCGRYIEKILYRLLPGMDHTTKLTRAQEIAAEAIGITLGCLLGMLPLLFW